MNNDFGPHTCTYPPADEAGGLVIHWTIELQCVRVRRHNFVGTSSSEINVQLHLSLQNGDVIPCFNFLGALNEL